MIGCYDLNFGEIYLNVNSPHWLLQPGAIQHMNHSLLQILRHRDV